MRSLHPFFTGSSFGTQAFQWTERPGDKFTGLDDLLNLRTHARRRSLTAVFADFIAGSQTLQEHKLRKVDDLVNFPFGR